MDTNLQTLYDKLTPVYQKDGDQDFPINKIRFFVDFVWNSVVKRELSEDQRNSLKQLIDLLNSLDDHKLSPNREMIQSLTPQLGPLLTAYPSLGHSFSIIFTTIIPSYQRYLSSLEGLVKDSHNFTREEVLLYYDMTLVDHIVLSHVFEQEQNVNLIEIMETIRAIIQINALTHDYLQDALNRSISLFTFLQRGGLAKGECFTFYTQTIDTILNTLKENVMNQNALAAAQFLATVQVQLAQKAVMEATPQAPLLQQLEDMPAQPQEIQATAAATVQSQSIPVMPSVQNTVVGTSIPKADVTVQEN